MSEENIQPQEELPPEELPSQNSGKVSTSQQDPPVEVVEESSEQPIVEDGPSQLDQQSADIGAPPNEVIVENDVQTHEKDDLDQVPEEIPDDAPPSEEAPINQGELESKDQQLSEKGEQDKEQEKDDQSSDDSDDAPAQPRTFIKPVTQTQPSASSAQPASSESIQKPTIPLEETVSKFSAMTFGWLNPLLKKAIKASNLTPNDLYPSAKIMRAQYCGEKFAEAWNRKRWDYMVKKKDELPSVMGTIFSAFLGTGKYWLIMVPVYFAVSLIAPILMFFTISAIENNNIYQGINQTDVSTFDQEILGYWKTYYSKINFLETEYGGYVQCGILLVLQFVYAYMDSIVTAFCFKMATQGFQALQDVLYLKMMKIKANNTQMRDVTNLLFTDSFKIQACFQYYPFIILYSLQGIAAVIIIIIYLRLYSVIGIGIIVIFLPIIIVVSNRNVTVQRVLLGYRDNRIGKVQEVLQGTKMIKYFRTELVTEQKLANVRKRELKILRKYGMVMIGMNMLSQAANLVMNAATFSVLNLQVFSKLGSGFNALFVPTVIYTVTYLYEYLNNLLLMLPLMFSSSLEANISGKRIRAFLAMPEIDQGLFTFHSDSAFEKQDIGDENEESGEGEANPWGNQNKANEKIDKKDLILTVKNVPSFTYAISEDLVIPPVLDTDFALHRDKVQKIIRSYDYFVDMYNNAYETFMDIYFADQKCEAFQQLKADIEILKRGPCFDYFKNSDNNPRKIIIGDHLTFQKRKKLGELDKQKYKRISHELIATLLDTWCLELDVTPISKVENLSLYDATKLTRRFEFDSDLDFLRRMFVNLRIVTPYYMRFKLHVEQDQEDLACSIRDLDINIKRGEIIGVCGSIGSGKSSLFNAILGEMRLERIQRKAVKNHDMIIRFYDEKTYDFVDPNFDLTTLQKVQDKNFKIEVKLEKREDESTSEEKEDEDQEEIPIPRVDMYAKKFALFTQNPVIFAGTIRHNIVFYNEFDQEKYAAVCSLCCLLPDFAEWPAGDMFQVGFDGVGLSGGQKARVALARCLYYEPELLMLDDPLSAVDAFVSKQLWQQLIQGYCRYRNMTVLIATHQTQFFGDCDRIFYLENGIILFDGTVDELAEFTGAEAEVGQSMDLGAQQKPVEDGGAIKIAKKQPYADFDYQRHCTVEIKSVPPKVNPMLAFMNAPAQTAKLATYKKYFKYGGTLATTLFFIMLFIQYIGKIFLQVFIGLWTNDIFLFRRKLLNDMNYIIIYAAVSAATLFLNFFALFTFVVLAIAGARNLHADMTRAIIRTKLSFFDITPNGTIVNKFTKDTESIDVAMMRQVIMVSVNVSGIITLIAIVVLNVASALVVVPVFIYYIYIFRAFRVLTPSLKKLDLVFKGPIISQSNETMRSLPVIRAMRYEKIFSNVFREKIDMNVQAQWPSAVCVRWLTYRINVVGVFLSTITSATAIAISSRFLNSTYEINPIFDPLLLKSDEAYRQAAMTTLMLPTSFSFAQLSSVSVVYSFGVLQFLVALILAFVQVEAEAVSVERVIEYTILPREGRYKSAREIAANWPKIGGSMEIKNLFFRYRAELPQVLKGITFNVQPYEHIGIVGRTGCAKSTMTMALFRINNPDEGSKIIFDGINILDDVGLHAARKGLAIVPQDPFVFSGTLRTTLDKAAELETEGLGSDEYTKLADSAMWEVLDRVNLGNYFRKCPGGLDSKITANATNLSSGQKQLLIFAASLISTAYTVIMDEATSQVDKGNDQMVQDIIREQMKDRIILSIAHRLDTVIEFDKILVMDSGQIIEFDRPAVLLRNKGHFFSLCKNTGRDNFRRLKNMALNMEREKLPELGIIDGIDEEFDENQTDDPNAHNETGRYEDEDQKLANVQNARAGIADLMNRATTDADDRDNTVNSNATVLKAKEQEEHSN